MGRGELRGMTIENSLDRHIHFHTHELAAGHRLGFRRKIFTKRFSRFLRKVALGRGDYVQTMAGKPGPRLMELN